MRTIMIMAAGALVIAGAMQLTKANAEEPIQRTDLVKNDIDLPGHEAVQVRVDIAPGAFAPSHRHPGEEIAYVLQGSLEYQLEGRKPVTLNAGQSLFIPSGVAHSARNVGDGKASELATYIVTKGSPLVVPAK
ncbi:cupin domain-containing protein [Rhizobium sp. 1399]|jgi:quercetin dioxygenase-like cupin family protein|uniref:cupin domain-containing protein n=1 Tax=Rhizobium sp. 1399 TaxID=2817758 RepID=UPI002862C016|nr:cupin domain-containing protein [Rhizobium sp. 1399]MDR6669615.1 quercetin dioxygenase-like cupin family protein [Rhizobium sp. 1399]